MAAEPRDADPFLVAIRDASGVPAGLGVLVGPREVVTCAHVVAAALDLPADLPERPDAEVTVRWPRLDGTAPVTADVVGWLSLADGDLAVLMLKDDAPEGADPARFAVARPGGTPSVATGQADRLRVFGYPETRPLGQWTEVRIVGQVDGGLLQLNTLDATLPDVRSGYSGSPVCDPATGTVIAVVAQAPPGGSARDSLAITASRVTEFLRILAPDGHRTVGAARRRGTRPERRYAPAAELTVLHLSDLQFGRAHRDVSGLTEADRAQDRLFARLHTDLAKLAGGRGLWPDLVVVTGDLAEGGLSSEFQQAQQFLEQLREAVDLPRHRLAIVPGNHDINRSASKAYFSDAQADEYEPQEPYWPKWRHYATAFEQVYGEDSSSASPEFTPERPWSLFEMRDLRVVVAGLNSTMAESHRDGDHYGWVGEAQLSWFARELRRYRDDGWLVLGAVHHNAVRKNTDDEENLRDAADLDRILGHRVPGYPDGGPGPLHLLLHGHTHDGRLNRLPSGLPALSTGSAAVVASARPAEVPDQYQFLTLRHDGFTRYTRAYLPDRKTWTGDNRADLRDDLWKGPDLFDLVGQHLRRLDVGDVTDAKVRHAVTRGGVVVLLDGFDELVQRVTYPTAAAYLDTLLEAATDEAKVVVTSRTQHFRDDSQIRQTLLGTRTGRQSTRIVALEDFSDPQIRTFLSHLYGGDEVRAGRRVDRLDEIKDLLGLSRNPRMLAFLAELPDNDLDEARSSGGRIRAADLYAKILDHWLRGEVSRQKVRFGPEPLSREHRWAACRELAFRLWATPNTTGDTVGVADLSETVVAALTELESLGFSSDQVTHAIGSGSLLTRTLEGFGFVHRSVMEWLVADTLATAVRAGRRPLELASSPMSDLMTDFFCDLAGPPVAGSWADEVLRGKDGGPSRQQESANATRVRARLRRRAALDLAESGEPAASAPETVVPLDLSGQDLRDQDLAAFSGPSTRGEPGGLRHAVLRDTIWAGKGVTGLDLAGADLTRADLEGTRLLDVDLTHATLSGARLAGAHLTRVDLRGADLRGADLNRAVLKDVDLRGADLDGSLWHRTAVLGGTQDAGPDWSFADRTTAVSGRDPAVPVLAVSGSVAAVAHLPQENLLAVARGNGVELVSLSTRTTLRVLTGHTSEVWAVGSVGLPGGRTLLAS
ncbi:MAG: hypothetical protein QG608_3008, partial [Actinomycetota bacterium]|nr:hypothetical protein [Actinomycetota bacterium]